MSMPWEDFGAAPETAGPWDDFAQPQQQPAPQPAPQDYARSNDPTMMGDIGHLLKTFYEDTKTGLKQAFAPQYTQPNRFDTAVGGAIGVDPNTLQKYVSTPASQVGGLMMALGGNVINAGLVEPARLGLSRLNRLAGGDESTDISGPASAALGLLAPQGLANAIPNLVAKTARGLTRSGVLPFRNAANQSAMNTAINAQNADEAAQSFAGTTGYMDIVPQEGNKVLNTQAKAAYQQELKAYQKDLTAYQQAGAEAQARLQKQLAERTARLNQVDELGASIVKRDPTGKMVSPAAQSLRKTPPGENVYAEFDKLKSTESFALPRVGERVKSIQEQFGEGVAPSLKPAAAVKAAEGLEDVAKEMGRGAVSKAYVELNPLLKFFENVKQMNAADFQTNMQGVGRLLHSSDARVAKAANSIYAAGMEDLRQAGTPASQALVKAMELHRQNSAADELGRMMTGASVAKVGDNGRVVFDPAKLDSLLSRDNWKINNIKGAFKEGELDSIKKTLADIYHVKSQIPAKEPKLEKLAISRPKEPQAPKLLDEWQYVKNPPAQVPTPLSENVQATAPQSRLSREQRYAFAAWATPVLIGLGLMSPRVGIGFGAALGATQLPHIYSQLIFKVAQKPKGQTLLRALYVENPPNLNDSAKVGVLLKYLNSEQDQPE